MLSFPKPAAPRNLLASLLLGISLTATLPLASTPAQAAPAPVPASSPTTESTALEVPSASGAVELKGATLAQLAHLPARRTKAFQMVGVTWASKQGGEATIQFRARANNMWSDWTTTSGEVDDQATGRGGTEPLFIGASDGIEVRVLAPSGTTVSGVKVTLLNPQQVAADSQPAKASVASTSTGVSSPAVITRAGWGANEDLMKTNGASCVPPSYDATIKAVILHHTEGTNNYTKAQSASIVRGIYNYHVLTRRWCDIGYNALVDKYGQVFEGRHGGLNYPVHGAHAGNWNTNTFGISMMMNSNTAAPSSAGLTAMTQMIAWKLANNYVAPTGRVTIAGKSINIIEGHGTVMATDCPGTNLRAYMPTLRTRVANAMAGYTNSPIYKHWQKLGGLTGSLGAPFVMEHAFNGGRRTVFKNGTITQDYSGAITVDTLKGQEHRNGYGRASLLLLDKASNQLWWAGSTPDLTMSVDPTALGGGWGAFNWVHQLADTNGDGITELVARRNDGTLWLYLSSGPARFKAGARIGHGWGSFRNLTVVPDQDGDRLPELFAINAQHRLMRYSFAANSAYLYGGRVVGERWSAVVNTTSVGQFNGDSVPDLVATTPSGDLIVYTMNQLGQTTRTTKVGRGWTGFDLMFSPGDLNGDGRADLIGRNATTGTLNAYLLTETYTWKTRAGVLSGAGDYRLVA